MSDSDRLERLLDRIADLQPISAGELAAEPKLAANLEAISRIASASASALEVAPFRAPTPDQPGRWGPLFLLELLATHPDRETFRVRDPRRDAVGALELFPPTDTPSAPGSELAHEGPLRLGVQSDHVLRVFGVGHHDGRWGLWREVDPGPTLAEHIAGGVLTQSQTRSLLRQVARGLSALHRGGLRVRDVSPSQVCWSQETAVLRGERARPTDDRVPWLAPEVWRGDPDDSTSDVYAAGALAFFALTGQAPIEARDLASALAGGGGCPRPLHRKGLSDQLAAVIERCLSPRVQDRYTSAEALESAVDA